jgi:tRNA-specific 2-thiouridylase
MAKPGRSAAVPQSKEKVLIALSGGPDSAVAGALMKSQGFDLVGIHVRKGEAARAICAAGQKRDAVRVAQQLEIPLIQVDADELFEAEVLDPLVHATLQCVRSASCGRCHQKVLIASLFRKAKELGLNRLVTGHYVNLQQDVLAKEVRLLRASDLERDQSHLLAGMEVEQLSRLILPLGDLTRHLTDRMLQEIGLSDLGRSSCPLQGAGTPSFAIQLTEKRAAESLFRPGIIRTQLGRVLADHTGQQRYQVGQKVDLGALTQGEEFYVVGVLPSQDAVVVGPKEALKRSVFIANRAWWLRPANQLRGLECEVWLDPAAPLVPAHITFHANGMVEVELSKPVIGLQPGQLVVFYRNDEVLGSARIDPIQSTHWALEAPPSAG